MSNMSKLDPGQIVKTVMDDATGSVKTKSGSKIISSGLIEGAVTVSQLIATGSGRLHGICTNAFATGYTFTVLSDSTTAVDIMTGGNPEKWLIIDGLGDAGSSSLFSIKTFDGGIYFEDGLFLQIDASDNGSGVTWCTVLYELDVENS
jgi:hypothetical protein